MTKTKIIVLLAFLLLFSMQANAIDLNAMTTDEVQAYITQLQTQASQAQQASVITIKTDPELTQQLSLLQSELKDLKASFGSMQERFNRLATDTSEDIEQGNKQVVADVEIKLKEQLGLVVTDLHEYIDQRTNPIRQNAPAIGAFLILAGCFMLWASRQYKLTGGK